MKKPIVSFEDFEKLDIRVGEIQNAISVDGSNKLLELTVDLGADYGIVTIRSGIAKYITPDKLIGNKYLFVANLAPRMIMGTLSQGMMLVTVEKKGTSEKLRFIKTVKSSLNGATLC